MKFVRSIRHCDICVRPWMLAQTSGRTCNNLLYFPCVFSLIISPNPPPVKEQIFLCLSTGRPLLHPLCGQQAATSHQGRTSGTLVPQLKTVFRLFLSTPSRQPLSLQSSPHPLNSSGKPYFCPLPNGAPWPGDNCGIF